MFSLPGDLLLPYSHFASLSYQLGRWPKDTCAYHTFKRRRWREIPCDWTSWSCSQKGNMGQIWSYADDVIIREQHSGIKSSWVLYVAMLISLIPGLSLHLQVADVALQAFAGAFLRAYLRWVPSQL